MKPPPLTRYIGAAERATKALLEKELSSEGIGYYEWTILAFVSNGAQSTASIIQKQAKGQILNHSPATKQIIAHMLMKQLLINTEQDTLELTEKGQDIFDMLSERIKGLTAPLFEDLPLEDLQTTIQVLEKVTRRAKAQM